MHRTATLSLALLLAGCSSPAPIPAAPAPTTVTVAAVPPAPPSMPAPHSGVLNLTLPTGSILIPDNPADPLAPPSDRTLHMEVWTVPTPYDFTVQTLSDQLPLHHDYQGIPWCSITVSSSPGGDNTTQWAWADAKTSVDVTVWQTGRVDIAHHDDGGELAEGCDQS